jgi:hypothetical protein
VNLNHFFRSVIIFIGCALAGISPGAAMIFQVERLNADAVGIFAFGRIEAGDADRFQHLVRAQTGSEVILFIDSPGGLLNEAIELADRIKRWRVPVVVFERGVCASACFLLLAASPERAMSESAQIGVHSASERGGETTATMALTTAMARAARELGAPDSVVGRMVTTPPDQMAWLTRQEVAAMRIQIVPSAPSERRAEPERRPSPPAVAAPTPPPQTRQQPQSSFERGLADRTTWESWVMGTQGQMRAGAEFWAANRSRPNPPTCNNPDPGFNYGCEAAKIQLARYDALRRSDPEYRAGWNAYGSAPSPAPTAHGQPYQAPQGGSQAQRAPQLNPDAVVRPFAAMRQRHRETGLIGLRVSWQECEQVVQRNNSAQSAEYCLVLVYSAHLMDKNFMTMMGRDGLSSPGWDWESIYPTLVRMFDVMNVPIRDRQARIDFYGNWILRELARP